MKAKLMSYNQIDFQSKAHMKSMIKDIEEQVEKYGSQMKKAGLVSFVLTQIWNKQGKFRLGSHFSYRDEKAFVACQKILNGIPQDEDNPTVTNADRGIVLLNFGNERLDHLDIGKIKNLIEEKGPYGALPQIFTDIYLNDEVPENRTIRYPNRKYPRLEYHKDGKWITEDTDKFFYEIEEKKND